MGFDLNLMRVFLSVMEERSVTRAAKRLHLTQPAVSYALTRLREQFNDPLFLRTPAGMQPTPVAHALAEPIERGMSQFAEALNLRQAFDPARSQRRFRLSMSDIGEMVFLPAVMEQVHARAPRLRVEVQEVPMEQLPDALKSGEVDLAIGNLAGLGRTTQHAELFAERYVCMGRRGHPVLSQGLTRAQFRRLDHIMVASRASAHRLLEDVLGEAGLHRQPYLTLPHFSAAAEIVRRTDLTVTLPFRAAQWFNAAQGFEVRPLPFALPPLTVTVHWHPRFERDPGTAWLRGLIIDVLADGPARAPSGATREP
ncbi:LysR family transcriptional regulator [Bordetella genomosp. 1]|uniref:LysR family transcriptional regulator n=1 Tax=Bordetella genomosp. 1 TaxID=1395607 RepID=A0ABX4F349_9BORD|nr:LysR family transcriptional regulator [Bordetella genomosp. 1]MDQ8031811.1 LysR family transcriptional regulator [Bordetella sp.]OZI65479.1 LysR family transcriptional regulator [Bordetella genomosp. 1]